MTTFAYKKGFALISAALLIALVLAFALVLIDYSASGRKAAQTLRQSLTATQIADAGVQKAQFCINASSGTNCGGQYSLNYAGETNVSFGGGTFTTVVVPAGSVREVTSTGTSATGDTAVIKADLTTEPPQDDSINFGYALQAGDSGAHMENNSTIHGTIYADGNIDCTSATNAIIDGDAYVAKAGGTQTKCKVLNNAYADSILNATVVKDAHYLTDPAGISGTTVSGVKYPNSTTPTAVSIPDINLDFWHNAAEDGGVINGDYYPADNSTLGPVKIIGNLVLGQNIDVTIKGPVWVVGNINTQNGSSMTLDSSFDLYGTVLLADDPNDRVTKGKITVVNGTTINGSGNPKCHILMVGMSNSLVDTDPAISVAQTAQGVVFLAPYGTLRLQNNAGAKSLAAKRLFLDQNSTVTYDSSELADMHFSASPSGVFRVNKGSWRQIK
ncbi:MAG TPA: hypothetical protein VL426_06755 [Candidatus Binatia bacterium]|nr:hypothetical protein [Candidatus Binatia bacterium]